MIFKTALLLSMRCCFYFTKVYAVGSISAHLHICDITKMLKKMLKKKPDRYWYKLYSVATINSLFISVPTSGLV